MTCIIFTPRANRLRNLFLRPNKKLPRMIRFVRFPVPNLQMLIIKKALLAKGKVRTSGAFEANPDDWFLVTTRALFAKMGLKAERKFLHFLDMEVVSQRVFFSGFLEKMLVVATLA